MSVLAQCITAVQDALNRLMIQVRQSLALAANSWGLAGKHCPRLHSQVSPGTGPCTGKVTFRWRSLDTAV